MAFLGAFVVLLFGPKKDENKLLGQTTTTHGSNSPATIQSATASGSSTVIQAQGGMVAIAPSGFVNQVQGNQIINFNQGLTVAEVLAMMKHKFIESLESLNNEYKSGWVMLGVASGKTVYTPEFDNGNRFTADFARSSLTYDNANNRVTVSLVDMSWSDRNSNRGSGNTEQFTFPMIEGRPIDNRII